MFGDAGRMLGKYHLIAEIARGGMGVVYLALVQGPSGFNKLVVVKELKQELVEDPTYLTMFLDEARLAARLSHPSIVQTNEVGNDGDRHFMAMEYLDGRTYDRARRRAKHTKNESFTLAMQIRLFCDVLSGLDYAHKLTDFDGTPLAVVHRDISPTNVFITFDGHAKLLDFGIAKAADHRHETIAGVLKGKVAYMAPEQARGQTVDSRADLFSVGVMLWEAIAGTRLRTNGNGTDELAAALSGEAIPRVSSRVPSVDPELDEIVARAVSIDRDERYMLAVDFQSALEDYLTRTRANPTQREIAAVMSGLFREDRAKANALIDSYVTKARAGAAMAADLPVIELTGGPLLHTPVPGRPSDHFDATSSGGFGTPSGGFGTPSLVASNGAKNVENVHHTIPPAPRSKTLAGVLVFGALIVGGIGFAAYKLGRSETTTPNKPLAAAAAPTRVPIDPPVTQAKTVEQPVVVAPDPALVEVSIRVQPANATITIDDARVSSNPFQGKYREDGVMHRVRATAPGFEPATRDVPFAGNVTLDIDLEREAQPTRVVVRRAAATRGPARTVEPPKVVTQPTPPPVVTDPKPDPNQINPNGGQKPRRTIDSRNPYEK